MYLSLMECAALVASPTGSMGAMVRCLQELPIELILPGCTLHDQFLACAAGERGSVQPLIEGLVIKTKVFFESEVGESDDLHQVHSDVQVTGECD